MGINAEHALCSAKACGHEPGGIERLLEQARQSERDWRTILRDFIAATSRSDYRWAPPNRRFVSSGLYLPSVERSCVGDIVIAVNASGCIGTKELEQFAGEINAIASDAQPDSIHVIYCDTVVQAVEEFGPSEAIKLSPKGGGGTDFVPPFKWVEENGIEPKCLIYLTDLYCNSFPAAPDYPVLWVTNSRRTPSISLEVFQPLLPDGVKQTTSSPVAGSVAMVLQALCQVAPRTCEDDGRQLEVPVGKNS